MLDPWSYAEKTNTEHAHQAALFMWANMAANFGFNVAECVMAYTVKDWAKAQQAYPVPQLKWMHAIPNQGTASVQRGTNMKAEGVKAGVFDVFLPYPSFKLALKDADCYCGLYIEMKRPKTATQAGGKLRVEQEQFKEYAESVGYKCVECWHWLEARDEILKYLGVANG